MSGKIILVTLPIGNLSDITERALSALKCGSLFYVEDTRNFKLLLNHYNIPLTDKSVHSFHDHSEEEQLEKISGQVSLGEDVYICSDAGSPVISDPAYPILKMARERNFTIDTYPGVSSVLAALELSALPVTPFTYHGFLPRKAGLQLEYIIEHASKGLHIIFESPKRFKSTLKTLASCLLIDELVVCRELTKKFQQVSRITRAQSQDFNESLLDKWLEEIPEKGEIVILYYISVQTPRISEKVKEIAQEILDSGARPKTLAKLLSGVLGGQVDEIYSRIINK